jgi:hypothetical protein
VFKIKNVCNYTSSYDVTIEELENTTMDLNAIRYKLDNEESAILGSILPNESQIINGAKSSRTIKSSILLPNEEKTYSLRR